MSNKKIKLNEDLCDEVNLDVTTTKKTKKPVTAIRLESHALVKQQLCKVTTFHTEPIDAAESDALALIEIESMPMVI